MPDITPHLGLPLIAAGQAQKHVTHNEALALLDALVQLACLDKDLASPPANAAEGDRYLVAAASPTGAWTGLSGQIVRFTDGVWVGAVPAGGWLAYLLDEKELYAFDGQAWASLRGAPLDRLGVNTQADAANRLAVKANAALFTWDDVTPGTGDMRITLNKKAAAQDASVVFQTGYASRALFGLLAGDDFVLKTSPDGAAFATAFTASAATGAVSFATSPTAPTPASTDSTTRLATTAFVGRAVAASAAAGTARTEVSRSSYAIQPTDRTVAVTALSGGCTLTLPAASAFPQGSVVTVVDESGACAAANTITVARAGAATINGLPAATIATAFGYLALQSDGASKWTVVNRTPLANRRTFLSVAKDDGRQSVGATLTRITLPNLKSDSGGNWDAANNWYRVPVSGIYQIAATLRVDDNIGAGAQYGLGVHTSEEDGPHFLWHAVGASPSIRSSYPYSRLAVLTAGDRMRMFSFADKALTVVQAGLQICLVADAA